MKAVRHVPTLAIWAVTLILPSVNLMAAGILKHGNKTVLNSGETYQADPKTDATQIGLGPNVITDSTVNLGHSFPFSPSSGDYPGTDQIYLGTTQAGSHDGYSQVAGRLAGPQVITMDYTSLIPTDQVVSRLTLGIGTADFQHPDFGQPFFALIKGTTNSALTSKPDSLSQTGPVVHFFTSGLVPSQLTSNNLLASVDQRRR